MHPASLMVLGTIGNDYYLGGRLEKIEDKLELTMTKTDGEAIEKDIAAVKLTAEGLKTDMNELRAHVSARVPNLVMDCTNRKG